MKVSGLVTGVPRDRLVEELQSRGYRVKRVLVKIVGE
jgi:hypothetical protein